MVKNFKKMVLNLLKVKKIFFCRTYCPMALKLGMLHRVLENCQNYSKNDFALIMTLSTFRLNIENEILNVEHKI